MKDYGGEKKDAGDDAKRPMLSWGPIRVLRGELSAEGKRNQKENDEPTCVQVDRDAENASQAESSRRRGILSRNRGWAGC